MRFVGNPTPWTPEQKKADREHHINFNSHSFKAGICTRCGFVNDGKPITKCLTVTGHSDRL